MEINLTTLKKNLIIAPAGDKSLHKHWISDHQEFDLVLLYYGNSDEKVEEYKKDCLIIEKKKLEKWHLMSYFVKNNLDFVRNYETIWFPDDDMMSNCEDINKLFSLHKKHNLLLSQPSVKGYVSYDIEKKIEGSVLRFTNFVEIFCPMMSLDCLMWLLESFGINESGWGMDYLWPKLLGYPKNKIAIIDMITVEHTNPIGETYKGRFKKEPMKELTELFAEHKLTFNQQTYSQINL